MKVELVSGMEPASDGITSPSVELQRHDRIDHVRGLAAFMVMAYHVTSWTYGATEARDPLARFGLYAVPIFFMISGMSLQYVYGPRVLRSETWVRSFLIKRTFRIFPLLWLVVLVTWLISPSLPLDRVWLTLSGLFSVYRWDEAVGTGVWSIGNELCFYALFPLFSMVLAKRWGVIAMLTLAVGLLSYTAFISLDPALPLSFQQRSYTAPYFMAANFIIGMIIPKLVQWHFKEHGAWLRTAMFFLVCVLAFYPMDGNMTILVQGIPRIFFSLVCAGICVLAWMDHAPIPRSISNGLSRMGAASYSLYLLHPAIYNFVTTGFEALSSRGFATPTWLVILMTFISSIAIADVVYRWYEQPFIRLGKRSILRSSNPIPR